MDPEVIAGRYEVVRAIGRGGMGTVWLCLDLTLQREVAVKRVGALPGDSPEAARAMREARIAASLNHPNAVAVYDIIDLDDAHWLVMEYVEGSSLAELVRDEGPLSPVRCAQIGSALARVLDRAHERGIVHRDVKPSNILIHRSGTPKLSDFGIARGASDAQLTITGQMTGTPGFLSPELARGEDPTPASDTWALGATLFQAVEGRPPFEERDNPLAVLQDILADRVRPLVNAGPLARAIEAMMDPDPGRRWTMAQAADQLDDIAAGRVPTAVLPVPTGSPAPATRALDELDGLLGAPAAVARSDEEPGSSGRRTSDRGGGLALGRGRDDLGGHHDDRRPVWPWALLVAALLAGGLYLVVGLDDVDEPSEAGGPTTTNSTTSTTRTSSPVPSTPSRTPTQTSQSPSATGSASSPAPSASTSATPSPSARGGDAVLEAFVRDYYAAVTDAGRRDETFAQLTPSMQRAAGGRAGYEGFWRTIESVGVAGLDADAAAGTASMRLTFRPTSGGASTEQHRWTLERDGDRWLVSSDRVAG